MRMRTIELRRMAVPFDTWTLTLFVAEDRDTARATDAELGAQRRIRHARRRGADDAEDVVVAREGRHVPRARSGDVLAPRARLGVDDTEDRRTGVVGRCDVELPVTRVVPDFVSAADLCDVAD